MGCVALEITQRCNLDCSLCYLSENAEAVRDLPLQEIFARIESIRSHYGPGTEVQITGGDPTLRRREELAAIVSRIRDRGMRASLFTNGIRATRELLSELARCGLTDVAFHVDMTQKRRGYGSEKELNRLRRTYIERARGLPLAVIFNTTVFEGNFADVPEIVRFFRAHADAVNLAAFQLQADTGRGALRGRAPFISPRSVAAAISAGAGVEVNFDAPLVGHRDCNRYAVCLEANGRLFNVFEDTPLLAAMFAGDMRYGFDRRRQGKAHWALLRTLATRPRLWGQALRYAAAKAWEMAPDLVQTRGRFNKLSFFIHNFMDAAALDEERCQSCVFMVATAEGPVSMCVHNAKRDAFIMKPITLETPDGPIPWHPLFGADTAGANTAGTNTAGAAHETPSAAVAGAARATGDSASEPEVLQGEPGLAVPAPDEPGRRHG